MSKDFCYVVKQKKRFASFDAFGILRTWLNLSNESYWMAVFLLRYSEMMDCAQKPN